MSVANLDEMKLCSFFHARTCLDMNVGPTFVDTLKLMVHHKNVGMRDTFQIINIINSAS